MRTLPSGQPNLSAADPSHLGVIAAANPLEYYQQTAGINPANLHVDFAQFGNHVFALYENKGIGFACDAAPLACQVSNSQPSGKVMFSGLKAGEYYMIVEASAGGSEGSVVMQLSAQ